MAQLSILIVDPSKEARSFIIKTLQALPYAFDICEADSVAVAARAVRDRQIDIAFAATDMEAQRGQRQIFRLLKECRPRPFIAGIVRHPIEHEVEFERAFGVRCLLRAPLTAKDTLAAVAAALEHIRRRSAIIVSPLPETRQLLKDSIERCMFRLTLQEFDDVASATDDLDLFHSDLVIVDADQLPGKNFGPLSELQRVSAGTPVIAMSSDRDSRLRLNLRAAGATGFLLRPFLVQDLDILLTELQGFGKIPQKIAA